MLFQPKIELGKATKALVRYCKFITDRDTTQVNIRGFYFRNKDQFWNILYEFIPDKEFWNKPYHKYSRTTFDNPNVNENMWLEFGHFEYGNWTPCVPEKATHVGLYFWNYGIRNLVNHSDEVLNIERKVGRRTYYFVVKELSGKVDCVDFFGRRYDGD